MYTKVSFPMIYFYVIKISDLNNPSVESINALDYESKLDRIDKLYLENIRLDGFSRLEELNMENFYHKKQLAMSFARAYARDVYDNSGYKNDSEDQAFTFAKVAVRQMHIDAFNAKLEQEGFKTYIKSK